MIDRSIKYTLLLCLLTLVGCSRLPFQPGSGQLVSTSTPGAGHPTSIPVTLITEAAITPDIPGETEASTQTAEAGILRIWLPPEFDPEGNSPASQLLNDRLDEFEAQNPGTKLDVRVKALDGTGGLLDALVSANAAAPLALPDLVLLPRPLLESAALKGLLHPYDGLSSLMDDPSWFDYARQLAHLKSSTYGIPFAGDAMALAYHPSGLDNPPDVLESGISLGEELLFPATDPQALFTLGLYLAPGESLQDAEGRPSLEKDTLAKILETYQRASQAGAMPYWITQYSNDQQVWEAFMKEQFPMAVTWTSTYIKNKLDAPDDLSLEPLPTLDGSPFTLATGWSWALAGTDLERRDLSARLAEFLVEKEFLASWSYAAGYLPPRVDALRSWEDAGLRQLIEQISYSAQLMPPADLISSIGPAVEQAVVDVLKAQSGPDIAAQTASDKINNP
jgi:ABC-type glycerol-3-phosphate transport system substrate-binding protein